VTSLHRLHDLVIASNVPIAGVPGAEAGDIDLHVTLDVARETHALQKRLIDGPLFTVFRKRDGYRFDFPDGTQFVIDRDGTSIRASGPPELAAIYLVNTVMAFVLRLRGHEVLHASCANIDGVAVAFAGPGGSGKSTLAACLAQRGFSIVSEDVTALVDHGDRFEVLPSHRRLRLWSDAAALIYGDAHALPWLAGTDWKHFTELPDTPDKRLELAAIYSIDDRRDAAPHVEYRQHLPQRPRRVAAPHEFRTPWPHHRERPAAPRRSERASRLRLRSRGCDRRRRAKLAS